MTNLSRSNASCERRSSAVALALGLMIVAPACGAVAENADPSLEQSEWADSAAQGTLGRATQGIASSGCSPLQQQQLNVIHPVARSAANAGRRKLFDPAFFGRWFGVGDGGHEEQVDMVLQGVELRDDFNVVCEPVAPMATCNGENSAYTIIELDDSLIHVCVPGLLDKFTSFMVEDPGSHVVGLIHEMSHLTFPWIDDESHPVCDRPGNKCYGADNVRRLAQEDVDLAVTNADSYARYAAEAYLITVVVPALAPTIL